MKINPYKIVSLGGGYYGVQYIDYPQVGLPESWGSLDHAKAYMASRLGLTREEYKEARNG